MRFDNTLTTAGILCGNTHKLGSVDLDPTVDDPKHSQTLLIRLTMFIEYRLGKLFERITADFAMPLLVVFWFGREFKLSSKPTIAVYVPTLSALGYFIPPKLNRLGAAFVGGRGNCRLNLFLNENGTLHTGCYMCVKRKTRLVRIQRIQTLTVFTIPLPRMA